MKKNLIIILFIFLSYLLISKEFIKHESIIPEEAIRIRVLANSNDSYDQEVKSKVSNELLSYLNNKTKDIYKIENARNIIINDMANIKNNIRQTLNQINYPFDFDINYGYNYFPNKEFKGINYDEGYYESLVVTLGRGNGDNFWCLLFPPLCFINSNMKDAEYTSIVQEIINKYLRT